MCCIKENWRVVMVALLLIATAALFTPSSIAQAETFRTLHSFSLGEGADPRMGALVTDGSSLYGTTFEGTFAEYPWCTVFGIDMDGSNFRLLHTFALDEGYWLDGVTLSGSTLYGTAEFQGPGGLGTIYKLNVDGSGFSVLHSFDGYSARLNYPSGVPVISGSTLYGSTNPQNNMRRDIQDEYRRQRI